MRVPLTTKAVAQRCFVKKCLNISQNSQQNKADACNYIKKETQAQVLSSEFCKFVKNTFFYRKFLLATFVTTFEKRLVV